MITQIGDHWRPDNWKTQTSADLPDWTIEQAYEAGADAMYEATEERIAEAVKAERERILGIAISTGLLCSKSENACRMCKKFWELLEKGELNGS